MHRILGILVPVSVSVESRWVILGDLMIYVYDKYWRVITYVSQNCTPFVYLFLPWLTNKAKSLYGYYAVQIYVIIYRTLAPWPQLDASEAIWIWIISIRRLGTFLFSLFDYLYCGHTKFVTHSHQHCLVDLLRCVAIIAKWVWHGVDNLLRCLMLQRQIGNYGRSV